MLNIDIGFISEDMNNNGLLDTEDQDIYGPGLETVFLAMMKILVWMGV